MRFHLYIFFTMFYVQSSSVFFSLCLFDLQLLFLNTCQKVINGVGWPGDHHGLSPILYDTAPVFIYTDQLLCHCVFICSNFRKWLFYCMRWLLWCFCLLAESYETINHYHYHIKENITIGYWNTFKACSLNYTFTFCAILDKTCSKMLHVKRKSCRNMQYKIPGTSLKLRLA